MLKIFKPNEKFSYPYGCALILGGFDGVHVGHLKLINRAKSLNIPAGILTISGAKGGKELFTLAEREKMFSDLGLDFVIEAEFSADFKNITAEEFLNGIIKNISVKAFVCGKDFRFGRGAEGDGEFILRRTAVPTYIEDIALDGGVKISSGSIKKYIEDGRIEKANSLLAFKFLLGGTVLHGRRDGRKMGFPTVNMEYPAEKVRLKNGVYGGYTYIDGKKYKCISNLGGAPTFGVERELFETYIDGFSGDLYGKEIAVYPAFALRDIKKFSSVEELKKQLLSDINLLRSKYV